MSLWDRLSDDPLEEVEVTVNGETKRIMKAEIYVKFEGTYEELLAWAPTVFKDPTKIPVRVQFGEGQAPKEAPHKKAASEPPLFRPSDELTGRYMRLRSASGYPETDNLNQISNLIEILRAGDKINAIKAVRLYTGLDLKEAKDFVEALAEDPVAARTT